jgi:hypothetical protein
MAITVKKTFLWKKELDNHPGAMAEALEPLAEGGADLHLVMVYRFPDAHKGAIEVHPISGRKLISTAKSAGLAPSPVPVLLVVLRRRRENSKECVGILLVSLKFGIAHRHIDHD